MMIRTNTRVWLAIMSLVWWGNGLLAHNDDEPLIDIRDFVNHADVIFKGTVVGLDYRNSESATNINPATGLPTTDGSNIPHTFITYQVDQVFKGSMPASGPGGPPVTELTLRMEGGKSDTPDANITDDLGRPLIIEYVEVATFPMFDIGDKDVLFVERNTFSSCPLVGFENGRFRVIDEDPNNPLSLPEIYTEDGLEIIHIPDGGTGGGLGEIGLGPHHSLVETRTHTIDGMTIDMPPVHPPNEYQLAPPADPNIDPVPEPDIVLGTHFTEAAFDQFVTDIVLDQCTSPPNICGIVAVNADISQPFFAAVAFDDPAPPDKDPTLEPNDIVEQPRPWLDLLTPEEREAIFEQEREEEALLALGDENPVLPETPCDFQILEDGPLAGDISGPLGKRDCRVDLFDLRALAAVWMECNDPDDPTCFL